LDFEKRCFAGLRADEGVIRGDELVTCGNERVIREATRGDEGAEWG
jgi:hypothetical protein